MRIGICLWLYKSDAGGCFTFQDDLLNALRTSKSHHEIFCFYHGDELHPQEGHIRWVRVDASYGKQSGRPLNDAVLKHQIDLAWFINIPIDEMVDVPYIVTVWDLEHRVHPYFPEVSVRGWKWDQREFFYQKVLPKATYVITGTEAGKKEVANFYSIPSERIKVVPFATPNFALQAGKTNAPADSLPKPPYLFYPATLCAHKNHIVLLLALKILFEQERLEFSVVFTGGDGGTLEYINRSAISFGLNKRIQYWSFLPREKIIQLYQNAFALIFPSFFGPDNIPPLEAFALRCPVIAAQVSGAQEQMGDAALLFDPKDEVQLAALIKKLYTTPGLRETLIQRGLTRAHQWTGSDYVHRIFGIADEFAPIRRCWDISR